jgi:hypothetical protein
MSGAPANKLPLAVNALLRMKHASCSRRWGETMSLNCGHQLFNTQVIYEDGGPRWNDTDRENRKTHRKPCHSATLSTKNPTWTDPGLRGERPTTNRLSHGTAKHTSHHRGGN